jgi:uncharacterized Tic20 family protein
VLLLNFPSVAFLLLNAKRPNPKIILTRILTGNNLGIFYPCSPVNAWRISPTDCQPCGRAHDVDAVAVVADVALVTVAVVVAAVVVTALAVVAVADVTAFAVVAAVAAVAAAVGAAVAAVVVVVVAVVAAARQRTHPAAAAGRLTA